MRKILLTGTLAYSLYYINNNQQDLFTGIVRAGRVFNTGIKLSFKYYRYGVNDKTHRESADLLYDTLVKNSGIYVKFGQVIAQLDHIMPEIICNRLKPLCQQCEKMPFDRVEQILNKTYTDYTKIFDNFQKDPIGIASLGQVHKATLKNGHEVVVKIQHPRLLKEVNGDIALIKFAIKIGSWLFPEFKYEWLGIQLERNIHLELDFLKEGKNCERFDNMFIDNKQIVAPKIYWDHSSSTILIMSYEEGVSIENSEFLRKNKISLTEISKLLAFTFNEQIFKYGFVHADPHSGNFLVRHHKKHGLQLVVLDHGLYRTLDDDFKYNYSNIWRGVTKQNKKLIETSCKNINVKHWELFTSIIFSKRYETLMLNNSFNDSRFNSNLSKQEKDDLREDANRYHKEITIILNDVREEMVLLLKINEYLKAIDRKLGNPNNNFKIMMGVIYDQLPNNSIFKNNNESALFLKLERILFFSLFSISNFFSSLKWLFTFGFLERKTEVDYSAFGTINNQI